MKNFRTWVREFTSESNRARLRSWSAQFYSPKEVRALLLFVALGVAVLLYRSGQVFYSHYFPKATHPSFTAQQRTSDSVFLALSAKARTEDSLIFALPEDSLLPLHDRARSLHTKGSLLAPHSIMLNSATKLDLMELPGVGAATADLILKYRAHRGMFHSLIELRNVKTIGQKRFDRMKPFLRLE